jgi:hypothetical protein
MIENFIKGFLCGARETPVAYFAPAIAIWRLLRDTSESLMQKE